MSWSLSALLTSDLILPYSFQCLSALVSYSLVSQHCNQNNAPTVDDFAQVWQPLFGMSALHPYWRLSCNIADVDQTDTSSTQQIGRLHATSSFSIIFEVHLKYSNPLVGFCIPLRVCGPFQTMLQKMPIVYHSQNSSPGERKLMAPAMVSAHQPNNTC